MNAKVLALILFAASAQAQQTALPSIPLSSDPQWDFGRKWVDDNLLKVPTDHHHSDFKRKSMRKHLVSIVQYRNRDGKESATGTGFFLQEDFPWLHTAAHVIRSLVVKDAKTYIFYWDGMGLRRKFRLDQARVRFSANGHDHAVIDLRGTPVQKSFSFKRTLLRSKGTPQLSDHLISTGFKGATIEEVRRNFFRIPQAIFKTAEFTLNDVQAGFCVSRKFWMERKKVKGLSDADAQQDALDWLIQRTNSDTLLSWLRNHEKMAVPTLSEFLFVYPDGRTEPFDVALRKALGPDPLLAGTNVSDSFCAQDTQLGAGMSGGPVFNDQKEVVGLNSIRLTRDFEGLSVIQTLDTNFGPEQMWKFEGR
ncbi:MAG: hypothetical protein JNL01_06230 [Bdellovibrionales bacterium]|nr:hypothetical protein [Bdellovibrionales bacterium]